MKFPIFILFLAKGLNATSERNPSEYIGNTKLYDFLLNGYDKRVNAYKNGNLTVIHQAVDMLWMNTVDPSTSSHGVNFDHRNLSLSGYNQSFFIIFFRKKRPFFEHF